MVRASCSVCNQPLAESRGPRLPGLEHVCDAGPCRMHAINAFVRQRRHTQREALHRQVPGDGPLVFVPAYCASTAPLPARRRAQFAQHLDEMMARAFAATPPVEPPSIVVVSAWEAEGEEIDGSSPSLTTEPAGTVARNVAHALGAACSTCRGQCCRSGGAHAWITTGTLQRVVSAEPAMNPETLRARYLANLPARTYQESCVFHTARGCALDPALRSDTCHRFLCEGATEVVQLVHRRPDASLRVAAVEGSAVLRARRVDMPHVPVAIPGAST